MYKYKLVLVDLDGTLLDFHTSEEKAIAQCFEKYNIDYNENNIKKYLKANDSVWKELEEGKISPDELRVERFKRFLSSINNTNIDSEEISESFISLIAQGKDLMDGAIEFLESIKENHIIAYITNGLSYVQNLRLNNNPITKYAKKIYISEETGYPKPSPKMIEMAMQYFSVNNKDQVIMVGDSISSDIRAAKNADVDSILISYNKNSEATYTVQNIKEAAKYVNIEI